MQSRLTDRFRDIHSHCVDAKALKDSVAERLNATAKELYDIDNFVDMIADETLTAEGDPEVLAEFLTEKGHPALSLEPMM